MRFGLLALCTLLIGFPAEAQYSVLEDVLRADIAAGGRDSAAYGFLRDGDVRVLVVTRQGATAAVARVIAALGGTVEYAWRPIGYLRVRLPFRNVPRLERVHGVLATALDGPHQVTDWVNINWAALALSDEARAGDRQEPEISPALAKELRDSALSSVGLTVLLARQPTFDGRGVTIALVETGASGIVRSHPAFRTALDVLGRSTPKIVDMLLIDPGWQEVKLSERVTAKGTSVRWQGQILRLPRALRGRTFRLGRVASPDGFSCLVAWDPRTNVVWFDLDNDARFDNERPLRDARVSADELELKRAVGRLGRTLCVTIDARRHRLLLHAARNDHASMTASIAAGATSPDNLAVGIAPAARLLLVSPNLGRNRELHRPIEALIAAATHPATDVISTSEVGPHSFPAGRWQVPDLLIDRIVRTYRKPIITLAGNGGSFAWTGYDGSLTLSVGAYVSGEIARSRLKLIADKADWIWPYSNRGPAGDGRAKPDLVAPNTLISSIRCAESGPQGSSRTCYRVGSGTSAATPVVAGLVAALISGAKQTGRSFGPEEIRNALRSSARLLDGWEVTDQGAGLPQAEKAWIDLKKYSRRGHTRLRVDTRSASTHALAQYYGETRPASSVYDQRTASSTTTSTTRELYVRRMSAGKKPLRCLLQWKGNPGAFTTPTVTSLPYRQWVRIPIVVRPVGPGLHSALLDFIDASSGEWLHQEQITTVVPHQFEPTTGSVSLGGTLQSLDRQASPLEVPPGLDSLTLDIEIDGDAFVRLFEPGGWPYHQSNAAPRLAAAGRWLDGPGTYAFSLPNPAPGVWTLAVTPGGANPSIRPVTFRARLVARAIRATAIDTDNRLLPLHQLAVRFEAAWGSVESWAPVARLATSRRVASRISRESGPVVIPVEVEPGTAILSVSTASRRTEVAGAPSSTMTDRDESSHTMYLFRCPDTTCVRVAAAIPAAVRHDATVHSPEAGLWKVVLVGGPDAQPQSVNLDTFMARAGDTLSASETHFDDASRVLPHRHTREKTVTYRWPAHMSADHGPTLLCVGEPTGAGLAGDTSKKEERVSPWGVLISSGVRVELPTVVTSPLPEP